METGHLCRRCARPVVEKAPAGDPRPSAGARLLAYLGLGTELAVTPGGLALAVQADHLVETVRLGDLYRRAA
jgi:hypothetical protein